MKPGTQVEVVAPRRQGAKFKRAIGVVLDATRSLDKPFPLVYFVHFADLGISAWFQEDQLARVMQPCHSDEDDPAA